MLMKFYKRIIQKILIFFFLQNLNFLFKESIFHIYHSFYDYCEVFKALKLNFLNCFHIESYFYL